ncbi:MAG: hypothetical protein Q7J38_13370 [Gallionella sp.]|nr:hypothetical protein [Gallionella sp.]
MKNFYSDTGMTWHQTTRLRIAPTNIKRLDDKIRDALKGARGRSLANDLASYPRAENPCGV